MNTINLEKFKIQLPNKVHFSKFTLPSEEMSGLPSLMNVRSWSNKPKIMLERQEEEMK